MLAGRSWDDWIRQYAQSHQNRWNQLTHSFGIPMIVVSLVLLILVLPTALTVTLPLLRLLVMIHHLRTPLPALSWVLL